jgi:hypothetical protein
LFWVKFITDAEAFSGKNQLNVTVVLPSATIATIEILSFVGGAGQQTTIHDMELPCL